MAPGSSWHYFSVRGYQRISEAIGINRNQSEPIGLVLIGSDKFGYYLMLSDKIGRRFKQKELSLTAPR